MRFWRNLNFPTLRMLELVLNSKEELVVEKRRELLLEESLLLIQVLLIFEKSYFGKACCFSMNRQLVWTPTTP